jgi:hypothetical protein
MKTIEPKMEKMMKNNPHATGSGWADSQAVTGKVTVMEVDGIDTAI